MSRDIYLTKYYSIDIFFNTIAIKNRSVFCQWGGLYMDIIAQK